MISRSSFFTSLILYSAVASVAHASPDAAVPTGPFTVVTNGGVLYTGGLSNDNLYTVNLATGASTAADIGVGTESLALMNSTTAYVAGNDSILYRVDLLTNTATPIGTIGGGVNGIGIANTSTAYIVTDTSHIRGVDLNTGAITSTTIVTGASDLESIAMASATTAYVADFDNSNVYFVDFASGTSSLVTTTPINSADLAGIALANYSTAYVWDEDGSQIYAVNLDNGTWELVTPSASPTVADNIILNGSTAYTASQSGGHIYSANLLTGVFSTLGTIGGAPGLEDLAFSLQMATSDLTSNNLSFANYINNNATIDVIREFALLGAELQSGLQAAAPTRNAFMTYAAQNAFLAASQVVSDHARQRQFQRQMMNTKDKVSYAEEELYEENTLAMGELPLDELLADAGNKMSGSSDQNMPCSEQKPYTMWVTPFGEYAREKSQMQTPGFSIGVGGVVAAFEYTLEKNNYVGVGATYVFSHVHEQQGAGKANINQGFLTAYGTWNVAKFYFDLGLWGGYYNANNDRKISFTGVSETARSNTHGWQLAPHLEVGYDGFHMRDCGVKWFGIEPFLMADWVANWEKGFKEHGAGNLNMGQDGRFSSLLRGETGLRFHEVVSFDWGRLIFREKGSYAYQKAFHTGRINAFLVGTPGSFTVDTLAGAQNLGVGEFSMMFISANSNAPYVDLRYQGEFGSMYQSHQGMLEIGKSF